MNWNILAGAERLREYPLLLIRLVLAYGFLNPAFMKVKDIRPIGDWFASLGLPFPLLNAYLATFTELAGVVLLTLGLFTRWITLPLMVTMLVAIGTVHLKNGFEAGNNGFEIPFYYLIFLFTLLVYGAGKFSADHWWQSRRNGS
jgi:putative oxidoreductase